MNIFIGILIPFIGTTLGCTLVFFMKKSINKTIEKALLGIASGVMIAASIWSLIIPSIEMAEKQNIIPWLPATIGFILGIYFLIISNKLISKLKTSQNKNINKMLALAVTLHNIPEGMAVGVAFAGAISSSTNASYIAAITLALGIAIQNFPEGAIISMPLKSSGYSKSKAFLFGVLSGIVEPIASFITILLTNSIVLLLPYLLAFAAGAMFYVVVEELIPESQNDNKTHSGTIGVTIGFIIMMVLDVALG